MTSKCTLCPELVSSRKRIVTPIAFPPYPLPRHRIMCIAEAPGDEENKRGEPLVGNSGQEARYQLTLNGIASQGVILDNICRCQPKGNRDPSSLEITTCTETHIIPSILHHKPDFIISMGRISTRFFLGDVDMELSHGIPKPINFHGHPTVIIPTYHPAAGLHNPEQMILFQSDLRIAGDIIRGKLSSNPPEDEWEGKEDYQETDDPNFILSVIGDHKVIAVDTEWARGGPWCLSISVAPGQSLVVFQGSKAALGIINAVLSSPDTITVIQNALYDLPVLSQMGIHPVRVADTMVMAYLLQTEPQGLKPLSFRHCGMKMVPYTKMVGDVTVTLAQEYLEKVVEMEWPDPEPVLEWSKGEPKIRQPQNIKRKAKRILNDTKKGANPAERWKAVKDGKEIVETVLGPLQAGELCDIPRPEAVQYSARDADATIRIYPILWERIETMGLAPTFWRDMGAMPMVVDMMKNGMPVDLKAFSGLSSYFQQRMDEIQRKMQKEVGFYFNGVSVNPASYPQMSALIYDYLCLQDIGGKFKSKKGAAKKSTADDILKRYVGIHPAVQDIIDWRGYQKLKTSYADAIPRKVGADNRVRTTIRMTRVATGRLSSSNPNLMAQPVRSSEGRKIRDCYVAEDGMVLLSGDYCLDKSMRILSNDYKWIKVGEIKKGDLLWGVDEESDTIAPRKCRLSVVESVKSRIAVKYKITMDDGSVLICTAEHPWLSRKKNTHRNGKYNWRKTSDLSVGWEIWKPFSVWEPKPDWESGYLAGLFDADGSLSFGRGVILTFIQNKGPLLDKTFMRLIRRGYDFHIPWHNKGKAGFPGSKGIVHYIWISNRKDIARFLGETRPQRLIDKAWMMLEGRVPPKGSSTIVNIECMGEGDVVSVQTSSKTFMCEGFITHNSQVEMRIAANDAKDEVMMSIFWEGKDIHAVTASSMFGIPIKDLDEMKHRYPAKRVGFGILNLITAEGLQRELSSGGAGGWSVSDCQEMIKSWFQIYKGVAAYMKASGEQAKRYGYIRDMWGRLRYIPGIRSVNRWSRIEAERQAGNAPIQMGAQGVIKEAMGRLVPVYRKMNKEIGIIKPLIQIHDDIVWEVEEWMVGIVAPVIKEVMIGAVNEDFIVPLEVDFKSGKKWGSMKKL